MVKKLLLTCFILNIGFLVFAQNETINQTDQNGLKQGKWIKYHTNGKIKYEGTFKDNKPIGQMKRYYYSGVLQADMYFYEDGKSTVTLFYENNNIAAKGNYIHSKKDSVWHFYSYDTENLLVGKETYFNNIKNGKSISFYTNGNMSQSVTWKNDIKDGPWQTFYENGNVKTEVMYKEGKMNGFFNAYFENGLPEITGKFENGLKEGTWKTFDNFGKQLSVIEYVNGKATNEDEMIRKTMQEFDEMEKKSPILDAQDPAKQITY